MGLIHVRNNLLVLFLNNLLVFHHKGLPCFSSGKEITYFHSFFSKVLIKPSRRSKPYKEDPATFISATTTKSQRRRHKSSSPSRHYKASLSRDPDPFERRIHEDSMNFVTSRRSGGGGTTSHYFSNKWDDSSV